MRPPSGSLPMEEAQRCVAPPPGDGPWSDRYFHVFCWPSLNQSLCPLQPLGKMRRAARRAPNRSRHKPKSCHFHGALGRRRRLLRTSPVSTHLVAERLRLKQRLDPTAETRLLLLQPIQLPRGVERPRVFESSAQLLWSAWGNKTGKRYLSLSVKQLVVAGQWWTC